jgi:hypothetical protein
MTVLNDAKAMKRRATSLSGNRASLWIPNILRTLAELQSQGLRAKVGPYPHPPVLVLKIKDCVHHKIVPSSTECNVFEPKTKQRIYPITDTR